MSACASVSVTVRVRGRTAQTVRLDRTTLSLVGIDSIMLPSEGDSTVLSGRNITFDPSHRHIRLLRWCPPPHLGTPLLLFPPWPEPSLLLIPRGREVLRALPQLAHEHLPGAAPELGDAASARA